MARIFITGSSDGLGSLAAQALVKKGHKVTLHARNAQRAKDAKSACPGAETVLIGDLSSMSETKKLADEINSLGTFDTIIHNAGLYRGEVKRTADKPSLPSLIAVNTIAPYILSCMVHRPKRLVFVSSSLHTGGDATISDLEWATRAWRDYQAYADTKLHNILLSKAIARRWPDVSSNSLDPGWVATKMGGAGASGDLNAAVETYVMLATGDGMKGDGMTEEGSGKYFRPGRKEGLPKKESDDVAIQDRLLKECERISGVELPQ
ncbi:NAD(P)-binding protein [Tothia fuscella]|uniref:NAD(P)-binding protein n=1 Tax=Tothia fuscella TaxID=1048955 RepID=A0A9P4TY49_9PEZI|nr:NAD(P)-binding protein [Tothia fuscella]